MKFSIIGTGFIFPVNVKAIHDIGGEIIDVVNNSRGENLWREMINTTKADCVVILTPNDLHFEMAIEASKKGKIVLCEKPLVIKSKDAEILSKERNIFTVLQLRHHPYVEKIRKEQLAKNIKHNIVMNLYFKRDDESYIKGWKNDKKRSGGFLFNLGIHYFDLLLYLFGDAKDIKVNKIYEKNDENPEAEARGKIEGKNYTCDWQIFINKKENNEIIKKREIIVNGVSYNFSSKDNLAEENLHVFIYKNLLGGKGINAKEALAPIKLVERMYQRYEE